MVEPWFMVPGGNMNEGDPGRDMSESMVFVRVWHFHDNDTKTNSRP